MLMNDHNFEEQECRECKSRTVKLFFYKNGPLCQDCINRKADFINDERTIGEAQAWQDGYDHAVFTLGRQ